MADPKSLLPWILGGAIGAGGLLQGLHWKSSSRGKDAADLETQLQIALEENELLKRENESLRSLAQGGGELAVPPEMIAHVEKEIGLHFLSNPVVHRIAGEELRDRVTAAIESRMGPSGIDDRQEAYLRIGWLRPQDNLLHQLASVRAVGARGWFDDSSGEAWVTDRFVIEEIPDQAVLLRLLTRILLHQNARHIHVQQHLERRLLAAQIKTRVRRTRPQQSVVDRQPQPLRAKIARENQVYILVVQCTHARI